MLKVWPQYCACWIIQKLQKCIFEWSKVPKRRILANIWSLVSWIDLILHIVILQDGVNNLAVVQRMLDHSKCIFEWSKEPKRRFLAVFLSLVCWMELVLHIVIVLNVFQHLGCGAAHAGSFKMHFWMIQSAKKEVFGYFSTLSGFWRKSSHWLGIFEGLKWK